MTRPVIPYDHARILDAAEQAARDTHLHLHHRSPKWVKLGAKEIGGRLEDRVRRAREYAVWRMAAYEAGETRSPW